MAGAAFHTQCKQRRARNTAVGVITCHSDCSTQRSSHGFEKRANCEPFYVLCSCAGACACIVRAVRKCECQCGCWCGSWCE
eukprot:9869935-Alexandrium_andersonii.AAC.1